MRVKGRLIERMCPECDGELKVGTFRSATEEPSIPHALYCGDCALVWEDPDFEEAA